MHFLFRIFAVILLLNRFNCSILNFITITQFFLSWTCTGELNVLYQKDVCDEDEFYVPYVRLLRTRQPYHESSPILKLLNQGYIDVSKHTGILCINGPAIVYTDINQDTYCDSKSEWIPSSGEPELFSHDCFSINRVARDLYRQPDQLELKKDSEVYGNKVFGVYLLGLPPDYRLATFVFLPRPDFGFMSESSSWCIHKGASLAFVTNSSETSSHCYNVKKHKMDGILSLRYSGNPMFCFRDDRGEEFDTPFHNDKNNPLNSQDIIWTHNCGEELSEISAPVSEGFEPEPPQLSDFRMIDPRLWSSHGSEPVLWKAQRIAADAVNIPLYSKPYPPGSMFSDDPGWMDPGFAPSSNEEKMRTDKSQKFVADISEYDCDEIPTPEDTCIRSKDLDEPCKIFNHVLTLDETDWKSAALKRGIWRRSFLSVINKIYEKACPQVSSYLPSSLSRIFEQILFKELEADEMLQQQFNLTQKQEWTEMLADLNKCHDNAKSMTFFKKRDTSAVKLKKQLEETLEKLFQRIANRIAETGAFAAAVEKKLPSSDTFKTFSSTIAKDEAHAKDLHQVDITQNYLTEVPLQFPYKILIGTPGNDGYEAATQIFNYREAAEVDHELDWALDAYWKIVTTVLGYCYIHYEKNEPTTFTRLYDSFSTDFLKYVSKAWIKGDNLPVYEQIFGHFIHGSGALWIDACHNGAYQWSEIVELRPLRPLNLTEGDIPPSRINLVNPDAMAPANFFLDNPVYSKLNVDHYEYYDIPDQYHEEPDIGSPELYTLDANTSSSDDLQNTDVNPMPFSNII